MPASQAAGWICASGPLPKKRERWSRDPVAMSVLSSGLAHDALRAHRQHDDHDDEGEHHPVGREVGEPELLGEADEQGRSEEHTSELQSLMRISYAVFCLKKKKPPTPPPTPTTPPTPQPQTHSTTTPTT